MSPTGHGMVWDRSKPHWCLRTPRARVVHRGECIYDSRVTEATSPLQLNICLCLETPDHMEQVLSTCESLYSFEDEHGDLESVGGAWENGKISSSPLNSQNTTINTLGAYLRQKCVWVKDSVICGSERSTRIGSHLYVCSPGSDTFPENLHSLKTQGDVIKPGRMPSGGMNPALILHLEDKGWDSHFTTIHKPLSLWCAHG